MASYDPEQLVFEQEVVSSITPVLGIEDRPKTFLETLFYAWQVTLVDFTPFIWAGMFVTLAGLPEHVLPDYLKSTGVPFHIENEDKIIPVFDWFVHLSSPCPYYIIFPA